MKVFLDDGAFMPERGHASDAGLDIKSPVDVIVPARGSAIINTGVHVQLPLFYSCLDIGGSITAGVLMAKSGLNVKHNITSTGLIDYEYRGAIVVKLYNSGNESYTVQRGDKISQLVIIPVLTPDVEIVSDLAELGDTERGAGGFGSTGR